MATDNTIKNFTAADIEKYHKGLLSSKERHALEKAALDDPFLADAMEGYAVAGVNVSADIAELKKRLAEKEEKGKVIAINTGGKRSFPWLRAAAAVILIAGTGVLAYQFAFNSKDETIAQAPEVAKQQTAIDSSTGSASAPGAAGNNTEPDVVVTNKNQSPSQQGIETRETNSLTGGGRTTDTLKAAEADLYKAVTAPSPSRADEKNTEAIAKGTARPAAPTKEKANDIAANAKKDTDSDGVADLLEAETRKAEEQKARTATANRSRAENQQYRNNANVFRGQVLDNNNRGIPFANVTNTQDNVGTYTDARGYFNLTSTDSVLNVQTRALGYNPNNIQLRNTVPDNRVVMQDDQAVVAQTLSDKKVNYTRRSQDANFKFEGEPEPEDGWEPYDSYLANNINIPKEFKPKQSGNNNGMVEVSFEVTKNGTPVNFKVEKSLCSKCDEEAIRLIKEGPKWKRKARKGRTTVAISF
jgi:hypothetical protein